MSKIKKTLSAALAGAMLFSCGFVMPAHADEADGPVAKITFDSSDDTSYTLEGGASLVDGRNGKALSLNGSNQYANVSGLADVLSKITGDFSISVWCNPSAAATWARIFDFGNGSTGDYAFLTASNGAAARFVIKNGTEQMVDAKAALENDEWQNVVISRSGSTTTFYINGKAVGSTEALTYDWSKLGKLQNYYLGKSQFDADPYYSGMIDDLYVFDRALTKSEIIELAGDAYVDEDVENINKYNCQLLETSYMADGNEVFAIANTASNVKSVTNVKNYTSDKAVVSAQLYSVKGEERTALESPVSKEYTSGEISDLTLEANGIDLSSADKVITVISVDGKEYETSELTVTEKPLVMPVKAPEDSNDTTFGVHDPSIVHFPGDDTYYVYSSHHLIFTSTDLVNWKKYDFTAKTVQDISPKTYNFISNNYSGTTCNGTYWAPDVIYVEGDSHPYWMYISVSCGLGGRNSAIALMKSDNPMFWADENSDIIDAGVVYATKQTNDYVTNAIDANIYYDTASNKPYFIWGSFWGGIQEAEMNNGGTVAAEKTITNKQTSADKVTFTVNNAEGTSGAKAYAAEYDTNGKLLGVGTADVSIASAAQDVTVDYARKSQDSTIKVFLWNEKNEPIASEGESDKTSKFGADFDGMLKGFDYSSDSSIFESSKNYKKPIFTQKSGVAGPEGAWIMEHDGYRYAFTSYGWLGSNYNTRVARSSLDTAFADSTLLDANGVDMSTQYDKGSLSNVTGYKLVGSYRLGDGSMSMQEDSNSDWYYPREAGDAHIYYGLGHNSAITAPNGETFYVSHTRKDAVEGAAWLQVRKMLWTKDGWPIVNSVTYAGEQEQVLPKSLIEGTYDIASVGHTKMDGTAVSNNWSNGHNGNRNYDLPVVSSKVTLNADGTMADGLGTWTFDGDHTVTLTFAKDGDTTKDEFYKSGDVMTLYALLSFDRDEQEYVISLTGTDQNHITQFGKKSMEKTFATESKKVTSEAISIDKSAGGNPELGYDDKGNILYGGDPAATVIDTDGDGIKDTVYLIVGHDASTYAYNDSKATYNMPNWVLYTSKNMTDWEYKGEIMSASSISWASNKTSAWAGQMEEYKGKYYFYYCTWDKTSDGKQSVGVAVADKPEGPYTDIGKPLVSGSFTTPESSSYNDIDPTVLIDTDDSGTEHRYLAWGNGKYYVAELNEDMTSIKDLDGDGQIVMHKDVVERKIKSMPENNWFTEAPWLYKRNGKYYLFYAQNWREEMAYAMADSPMGRYDFKQIIMPPNATANTNHPSVIDFNGKTYFIYHNGALPDGNGYRRSVCVQELEFDENGYVYPLTEESIGLTGTASTIVTSDNRYLGHDEFRNSSSDAAYPLSVSVKAKDAQDKYNTAWEIMKAKSVPSNENADYYVSLQSVNKPGLYISAKDGEVTLTQDMDGKQGDYMTFKTVKGINGKGGTVSFECAYDSGRYLAVINGKLTLSYGNDLDAASFTIGAADRPEKNTISIADIEPDPEPMSPVETNFDDAAVGTIAAQGTADQTINTYAGATVIVGGRSSGGDAGTYAAIVSGGRTGNALELGSGKFASSNRGARIQLRGGEVPDGYTMTGIIYAKLNSSNAKLFWGDSTGTQATNDITDRLSSTDWTEIKTTIKNNADTYTRTISVGGEVVSEDYVDSFPALWGTTESGGKVLFDDIKVYHALSGSDTPATPAPVTVPEPDKTYDFNGELTGLNSVNSKAGTENAPAEIALAEGKSGEENDKALAFTGENSGGVMLDYAPTSKKYTISFDAKLNTSVQYSPFILMMDYSGNDALVGDTDAKWVSIAPQGWQKTLSSGPMIWSRDVANGNLWNDIAAEENNAMQLNKWQNITVTANGTSGKIYVDGSKIAEGTITDIINGTTKLFVGVNFWDTPLDGSIDNIRIFNSCLSEAQVKKLCE